MFSKILVPIDGSADSYRGFEYACDIALKYGAEITLIHVVEKIPTMYPTAPSIPIPEEYFVEKNHADRNILKKLAKELDSKGIKVQTILVSGNPSEEILGISGNYDLIVIGSRGLGGLEKRLLGSVATEIAQRASVPVLVVRA